MIQTSQEVAAPSSSIISPRSRVSLWILLSVVSVAIVLHLWGIKRNLPFLPEADERAFVARAARIAASGDLNPGWFGHPGSTVIYPLAAVYYIWDGLFHRGSLVPSDPTQQAKFDPVPSEFFLIGRLLTILYEILSLPLIYLIGRRIFSERVGLIASWLSLLSPFAVDYAKTVRSDSAAVFFGLLAFWLCLRVYDRPSKRNQVAAGIAIGMAIATRYFMIALIPVLLAVNVMRFRQKTSRHEKSNSIWIGRGRRFNSDWHSFRGNYAVLPA